MGGMNSGRRSGRATVEGCASIVLTIGDIIRAARGRSASVLRLTANVNREAQRILLWLDIDYAVGSGAATLRYDLRHATAPTGPQHCVVRLVSTPCRLGGGRWWWVCPVTGRRVLKLYLPNGGRLFLSRAGYGLAYQSQREAPAGRAWRALRKVDARLGCPDGIEGDWIPKPKWMRWPTFNRLCDRREAAEEAIDADLIRLVNQLGRLDLRGSGP
ncbi:hypothetical protein AAFN86_23545 [Roseomonas sp. CAU 1739]|uniref:hypothetical protein n=1 Tax=Roseomonas sp. CAU 1739 TaxID=3140364 RepID=UPI00325B2208